MSHDHWQVQVTDKCLGSGLCTGAAPGHFRLSDGRSQPVADLIQPADTVVEAAETCPAEAILVRDAATSAVVAPAE
jgi:ferredoxin